MNFFFLGYLSSCAVTYLFLFIFFKGEFKGPNLYLNATGRIVFYVFANNSFEDILNS